MENLKTIEKDLVSRNV